MAARNAYARAQEAADLTRQAVTRSTPEMQTRAALALGDAGGPLRESLEALSEGPEQLPAAQADAERWLEVAWRFSEAFSNADARLRSNAGAADVLEHLDNAGLEDARLALRSVRWIEVPLIITSSNRRRRRRRKSFPWALLAGFGLFLLNRKKR